MILGLVDSIAIEACPHCGRAHGVVTVRGPKGSMWTQHQGHGCKVTTTKGLGPSNVGDLIEDDNHG